MKIASRQGTGVGIFLLLAAIAIVMVPTAASAQTQTFLNLPGIKGSSTDYLHKDWIDVVSVRQVLPPKKSPCEVVIVKGLDQAGPTLWSAAMTGKHFVDATVEVMRTGPSPTLMYRIILREVLVTSIVTYGEVTFAETVTLSGEGRMTLEYQEINADGSAGGLVVREFNCAYSGG